MRGHSLPELLAALAITGLATASALPPLRVLRDRLAVEAASAEVLEAYQRARLTALARSQPVRLEVLPAAVTAWALGLSDSILMWTADGPSAHGVTLLVSPGPVVMTPAGTTMGVANGRYVLERGGVQRTIVASRLGRLRVSRPRRRRRPRPPSGCRTGGPSG